MDWPIELIELFEDPLLEDVRPKAQALSADDRRVKALQEITEWVQANGRRPSKDGPLKEKLMCKQLDALRASDVTLLEPYDCLNLLKP